MKPVLMLVCSIALAGCYRYVPADRAGLASGMHVVIDLSAAGREHVRPTIGEFVTTVEGNVAQASADSLTLSLVSVLRRGDLGPSTWNGETIHLAAADMERVRRSELSRGRTTVAAASLSAAGVGLVYAIARAAGIAFVSGSGKGPVPTP
jgi:hypothetical protein